MTQQLQKASLTTDFTKLKELFGPAPVLSSEDSKAYDAMLARILESLKASDFIEQMLGKDLTDATWELKRYSRHKALVVERQIHEQQEMEEAEEAEEAEQLEESAEESEQAKQADKPAVGGEQIEQAEEVKQAGAPTTQFERMLELAAVVDSLDCDDIIAGPVDELEYAEALEANIAMNGSIACTLLLWRGARTCSSSLTSIAKGLVAICAACLMRLSRANSARPSKKHRRSPALMLVRNDLPEKDRG